ncbi:hypothetical protein B0T09DRAFT_80928 [Sordaria sp. MPI-SDFR-AT-0083]|nr:hypothetical protein B0T09DRAFT_80928 [Sordaria sp. MPI-SDFR-AT-0083]
MRVTHPLCKVPGLPVCMHTREASIDSMLPMTTPAVLPRDPKKRPPYLYHLGSKLTIWKTPRASIAPLGLGPSSTPLERASAKAVLRWLHDGASHYSYSHRSCNIIHAVVLFGTSPAFSSEFSPCTKHQPPGDGAIMGPHCGEIANRSTQSKPCQWLKRNEAIPILRLRDLDGELAIGYPRLADGRLSESLSITDLGFWIDGIRS